MRHYYRCYNKKYMEDHNIDWFFSPPIIPGLPCYSPSNGLVLPKMIKVQKNRELQVSVYNDIIECCRPYVGPDKTTLSYKQIERALFFQGDALCEIERNKDCRFVTDKTFLYLTQKDYTILNDSIDLLLRLEFGIENPTLENRNSFFYAYIEMARRGFICLYPYKGLRKPDEIDYIIIGYPNYSHIKERHEDTYAVKLMNRFPKYDASFTTVYNKQQLDEINLSQVYALSGR